ncbi:hypothetical protein H257_11398 [Aphanomyces astaci]|uniref:Uncharacterized protein n=1 Tax=Aphanomyces astaci TaxID=112090 RepID=W4G4B2_APHAT|nr:hypothetical protein H257_11398 [Aphanomyces astaci]ETV74096.1 hypothetical protein H257_11398 [Aphanomyces astaci]|eukprot:XP_009836609.1 hypothetical protein H257_11398 [Aphanomyces astaci]
MSRPSLHPLTQPASTASASTAQLSHARLDRRTMPRSPRTDPIRLALHAHSDEPLAEDPRHQGRHERDRETLAQRDKRRRDDGQRPPQLVHDLGQPTDPHAVKTFVNTATKEVTAFDWLNSTRKMHMDELHQAMEQLHREMAATSAKKRRQARDHLTKSKAVQLAIGGFVHVGQVSRQGHKLSLHCAAQARSSGS